MLKAGKPSSLGCEVWPRAMKHDNTSTTGATSDDIDDNQQVAPRYEASLSDAIQAALDSYDQNTAARKHR